MRRAAALLAMSLLAFPAFAGEDAKAEINAGINRLAEAFSTGDPSEIRALMTEDHLSVTSYYGRPFSVDEQVGTLGDFAYELVEMGPHEIEMIDAKTALVTARSTVSGSFQGRDIPEEIIVSQIWVERDGEWLEHFYQETPLDQ